VKASQSETTKKNSKLMCRSAGECIKKKGGTGCQQNGE